jgi:hypothetical protein
MATYYWVGGAGTWNATATTNWASSSGGAGGAGVPTSVDDVIFDANSNTLLLPFTVTVAGTSAAPAVCRDFSTGGAGGALDGAMTLTMGATAQLDCFGSLTLPAANLSVSGTTGAFIDFKSTSSQTLTSNGVSFGNVSLRVNGVGGTLTLGSALTCSTLVVTNGIFNTSGSNYNVTAVNLSSSVSNIRTITLNGSIITLSSTTPVSLTTTTNLTFNAGTSTINCSAASPTFASGGLTFYNVSFTSTSFGTITITSANTFNDLTVVTPVSIKTINFADNQTINGTLTLGATNGVITRVAAKSDVTSQQRTLTCNAVATLADVDFADIQFAGACISGGALTGTRLGNCGGNDVATIIFAAGVNKYWYTAAGTGGGWGTAAWELTAGGTTPLQANFPLAQDTIIFQDFGLNAGATTTITGFNFGTLDMSARTLTTTLASGTSSPNFHGDITLASVVTLTGTSAWRFIGQGTQNITSAGVSFTQQLNINNGIGSTTLVDNLTTTGSATLLTSGTLNLNNNTYTAVGFVLNSSNSRAIAFGSSGVINITGNNVTVWNIGATATPGFSFTGTSDVRFTYAGAVGTRTMLFGTGANMNESNSLNFSITGGTDIVTNSGNCRNLNLTGFTGTYNNSARIIYGNLTLDSGMTLGAGTLITTFGGTSGTQQITTASKTLDFPLRFDGIGGTFAFQDALTQGSTRDFTVINGTVQLKNGVTSTVGSFATSGTNQKFLQSTTPGSQATLSQASGTVNVDYLTIQDINATGGAVWFAPVSQLNIDDGNNDGWDFFVQLGQYMYTRRKNKRLLIS